MMLRKKYSFLLLVAMMLLFSSCSMQPKHYTAADFADQLASIPGQLTSDEEINPREHKYGELCKEDPIDLLALVDNETPLSELIAKQTISQESAWHAAYMKFDGEGGTSAGVIRYYRIFEAYFDIQPFQFVRDTGIEFVHHITGETCKRMYTVYQAEEGGYVYFFFDYCESGGFAKAKRALYVIQPHSYQDFKHLSVGDSIYDVAAIDPVVLSSVKTGIGSCHLLTDGVLEIQYEDNKIKSIYYNEDYLLPNRTDFNYNPEDPDFMNEEAFRFDLHILPQDYPQS